MNRIFRIALVGNPNIGKTTIFNQLTGARQHVGNYSGVTVESKKGRMRLTNGIDVEVVDLPGVYSLSAGSPEEKVAFRELISGDIDLVLNIIDSANAQRNLYLTTQLAELGIPILLDFNMIDDAEQRGFVFDFSKLESFFGSPVVTSVGTSSSGVSALTDKIGELAVAPEKLRAPIRTHYGPKTEEAIRVLSGEIETLRKGGYERVPARCIAIKLIEADPEFADRPEFASLLAEAARWRDAIALRNGLPSRMLMADIRYGVIAGACREAIRIETDNRRQISEKIDAVVTHRFWGLPLFFAVMYLLFWFTFSVGSFPMEWLEGFFGFVGEAVDSVWPVGEAEFFRRLLVEGVIGGVGGVLVFLPNIILLFGAIAFLEGSGYMARAAFVTDGFMHLFGLHGKSFIPMLLGFGCSVPAILCTRTIESERDRLTTILVLPFMSCGARLPIFVLFIPAFFPLRYQPLMMFVMYLIGTAVALGMARLLKSTLFRGDEEVFVMELPPYRLPTPQSILIQMWERAVMYLRKAGTLILIASVVMFVLNTWRATDELPPQTAEIEAVRNSAAPEKEKAEKLRPLLTARNAWEMEHSVSGRIGRAIAVVMKPLGFDWKASSALIGATAGKELFVAQLGVLNSIADEGNAEGIERFTDQLRKDYSALQAFCIMLFCLLSMPCLATVAVVIRETHSWKWGVFQVAMFTGTAYFVTLAVYQAGLWINGVRCGF